MITCEIDTSTFSSMCNELMTQMKAPPEEVLREEVGRVLSKALENTGAADEDKIRQHSRAATHSEQSATMYSPQRVGRRRLHKGKVVYNLSWRYPNSLWSSMQAARTMHLVARIRARGLAKRSWYRLGQLIGVKVEAPMYVRRAIPRSGKIHPENERSNVSRSDCRVEIILETSQPTLNAIGGDRALQQAIDGRVQYFIVNASKGVFDSMDKIVKKYPGIKTHGR